MIHVNTTAYRRKEYFTKIEREVLKSTKPLSIKVNIVNNAVIMLQLYTKIMYESYWFFYLSSLSFGQQKNSYFAEMKKIEKQSDQSNAQLFSFFSLISLAQTLALPRAIYKKEYAYTCYYRIMQRVDPKVYKHIALHLGASFNDVTYFSYSL